MVFSFVTGGCGGLGKAFVKALAARGDNLFLTGRSEQRLEALRAEISAEYPAVAVEIFACDLTDAAGRKEIFAYADQKGMTFGRACLVAGVDTQKAFEKYTTEKIVFQTRVNLESNLCLARETLARRQPGFELLAVGSMSGLYPMPYFAIYSATKKALESFFSSLRYEMKGSGVKITTVMPGGIPTRPDIVADIEGQGLWGRLSAKSPEYVAEKSLRAVAKNKRVCVPGFFNRFLRAVSAPLPRALKMSFIAHRWKKLEKDAF